MNNLSRKELMYIFKQIKDIPELLILREVCKKWNDIINLLLNDIKLWEKICLRNAISPWINKVLEKKYSFSSIIHYDSTTFDQSKWKEIYLFYKKWRRCVFIPTEYFSFNATPETLADHSHEKVTCINTWADYVIVGSNIGKVCFYLIRGHYEMLYYINYSEFSISEVKFWMTDTHKLIAVVAIKNHHLKFWDVEKQINITGPSENQSSTVIECKYHRLFVANNLEILEYKFNRNRIYEKQRIALSSILNSTIEQPLNIIGIYISLNELTIVGCNSTTIMTTSLDIPVLPHRKSMIISKDPSTHLMEQFSNNNFILCHIPINNVLLIIDDLFLYVAIKNPSNQEYEWKTYKLEDPLKRNISSALLFANILILGTKTGLLNLYVLKNIHHFSNLNLQTILSRSLHLSTEPITDTAITELKTTFYILAMTGSKLHIVKFSEDDFEQLNDD